MSGVDQQHQVHFERLHEASAQPAHVRFFARAFCHALVSVFHLVTAFFAGLCGPPPRPSRSQQVRVVLTGTFFSDNWVEAHVRPLALSSCCEHVWVVSDRAFTPMENVTFVCPPRWLQRLIGRVAARSLAFAITAAMTRADIVGGFHLLCNGLVALMVARMLAARAMYFCVGGWAEFVKGGVRGETRLFSSIGRDDRVLEGALLDAIRRFDLVLTMGTGAREFLIRCGITAAVEVMSGGIDQERYAPRSGSRTYDLVTVSRLVSIKRLDVFLDAVRLVSESIPSVTAAIVGDGPETDALLSRSAQLGISDRVRFVGHQYDVERWLGDSRLFVLTSDSEGLSLALMEAVMAGLPAVVSDVGDLGDLVRGEVNGWRVPPRRADLFAERIVSLLTNEDLYRRFSRESRRVAMALSVEAVCTRWTGILSRWGFRRVVRDRNLAGRAICYRRCLAHQRGTSAPVFLNEAGGRA